MARQATIAQAQALAGIGLHTGHITTLRFLPADVNTGIRFRRADLPDKPEIPARIASVMDTQRSTTLGVGKAIVQTVEHILASIQCLGLDNLIVEVNAPETPLTDGSARPFVQALQAAGRVEQEDEQATLSISTHVAIEGNGMALCALPADDFRISYTLSYNHPAIKPQFREFPITDQTFVHELAPARTFALYSELEQLLKAGLIKGGSLDNAVVITDQAILTKDGLRFPDEFVRHKIMDLIGDLTLTGHRVRAHVISIRSGHTLNVALARALCAAADV